MGQEIIRKRNMWVLGDGAILVTYGRLSVPHYTPPRRGAGQGYFVSRNDAARILRAMRALRVRNAQRTTS